jgi:cytochrome c-type biogenesis protein CcmH
MLFWIAAGVLAVATAAYVARPLALGRRAARSRAAHDEQVFRDQLAEVDRDLDRGVLTAEEARSARIEVSRRLLAAAAERERQPDHQPAPKAASYALAAAVLVGAPLGGWVVYDRIGAPGLPDQPLASRAESRPGQELVESRLPPVQPFTPPGMEDLPPLVAQLEARVASDGGDRQGLYLLARSYAQVGRFADSWRAYRRLLRETGGDAPAQVFAGMAESMILAARGYVSPEAEQALGEALRRDGREPVARFYMGETFAQTGRPQSAMEVWAGLLADSPPDAPWRDATRQRLLDIATETGMQPPPAVAAATPPQRGRGEILAMVRGLDERLSTQGGEPGQWAQLARSYRVMGLGAAAEDAKKRAREAFAADPERLAAFEAALADDRPGVAPVEAAPPPLGLPPVAEAMRPETPPMRGPDAATIAAAQDMAPEDRMAMIRGMVDGLRDRLYRDGGAIDEWARLIHTLGVLRDTGAIIEAYERGAAQHAGDPGAAAFLKERALVAGARFD